MSTKAGAESLRFCAYLLVAKELKLNPFDVLHKSLPNLPFKSPQFVKETADHPLSTHSLDEVTVNSVQMKVFQGFVQDALQQALPDLQMKRVEDPNNGDPVHWLDPIMVSIMRFQSEEMEGNAVLGCDASFLEKTCPQYDRRAPNRNLFLQDWIGELSNLILGRMKNKLLPYGVVIKLNPPSVTEASESIFETYARHALNFKMWFSCETDFVCLAFSLDINGELNLSDISSEEAGQLQPGDAIYRLNDLQGQNKSYDMVSSVRSGVSLDDNQLPFQDFDFIDDEMETLRPKRAEDQRPTWAAEMPHVDASSTLVASVLTTAVKDVSGRDKLVRRSLEGMEWLHNSELRLNFNDKTSYVLAPLLLIQQGTMSIAIEGYRLQFVQNNGRLEVQIPELQLVLEHGISAA